MRLPRFTTPRLIVLVAVVALFLETVRLLRWRAEYLKYLKDRVMWDIATGQVKSP